MSLLLSVDEIRALTGKTHRAGQRRVLAELGIPFRPREHDGVLLVSRSAAERALGGPAESDQSTAAQEWTVDEEAIKNHGKASATR